MISMHSGTAVATEISDGRNHILEDDVMYNNKKRCQQILECKRQIDFWRSKLDILEKEQTIQIKLARLRLDAASTWRSLSPEDRMEKKFILAAMESEIIPSVLDDFPNSNLPPSIRRDKDILLARVARHDFQQKYKDDRFYVPTNLRGDKEVMMSIISKHCSVVECMSNALRNDDEIFQAVLSSDSTLPPFVLQHFSERIRSDRNLMLQLCAHPDNASGLTYVRGNLRNDKSFMLEAIKTSCSNHSHDCDATVRNSEENLLCGNMDNDISGRCCGSTQLLRYTSQRLQNDREVVLAAVQKNGLNLKYASYSLRRDFEIVTAAINENGGAFRYCLPGQVKDRILSDRNLILNCIIKGAPNHNTLRTCLDRFKADQEVLLAIVASGIEWSLLPLNFQSCKEFAKRAIRRNPNSYLNLSEALRKDFEIASTVIKCDKVNESVFVEAIKQCPKLLSDLEAMVTISKCGWPDVLLEAIQSSPAAILSDKTVMLQAIKSNYSVYEFCSEELSFDRDIVLATIKSYPGYLYLLPDSFQLENPDIVICAIESCNQNDSWFLYEYICEGMWLNRDVAISWLMKFGDWLPDDFPEEFEEDEELCLALIKQNWIEFENLSTVLKNNKGFMLKAVAIDARVVRALEGTDNLLRYDYDLMLLAFSKDKRAIQSYSGGNEFECMVSFTERLRKRIRDSDIYKIVVYGNILRPREKNPNCSLVLLDQGPDAVIYHSRLIESYLGLPDEKELQTLYAASNNLRHWGF